VFFNNIYKDKTVLVTGHTGFKGSWLSLWLSELGANVVGLSLDIPSEPSNFEVSNLAGRIEHHELDIRNADGVKNLVKKVKPDFIFHLAAQALVRLSYESPLDTMMTNSIGSACILDALRVTDKSVVAIMITSDKVYDNVEWCWGYRETDRIGGKDPYSASKAMAELAIRSYVESYFRGKDSRIRVAVTRAGNVIGGGDWAKDRIVPDCVLAWSREIDVNIRSPQSTRPWQHVLDPLSGYIMLGADLFQNGTRHGEAYNFGPLSHHDYTVGDLIREMAKHWQNIKWKEESAEKSRLKEAALLKLNCDKALYELDWSPTLEFSETVRLTAEWYKTYYQTKNVSMEKYSINQIYEYMKLAKERGKSWTKV